MDNRRRWWGGLLVAWALLASPVAAQSVAVPELVAQKVSPHGWFFQGESGMPSAANRGYSSNAGFVVTGEGVVVFDALGTPPLGDAMVRAIRKITPQRIVRVIVSHYHADHVYGLAALKAAGAEIWAHHPGEAYFSSGAMDERLAQRRRDLAPWVDASTKVLRPDLWLEGDVAFRLGGLDFRVITVGGAHSAEDVMLYVAQDGLLFAGDLFFTGRIPFVGNADSRAWLAALERMSALAPRVVVPGHGGASRDVARDLALTRDYLRFLRAEMGRAVEDLVPFDEAYRNTDWSRYAGEPAFEQANRINAHGTYVLMESEALAGAKR